MKDSSLKPDERGSLRSISSSYCPSGDQGNIVGIVHAKTPCCRNASNHETDVFHGRSWFRAKYNTIPMHMKAGSREIGPQVVNVIQMEVGHVPSEGIIGASSVWRLQNQYSAFLQQAD